MSAKLPLASRDLLATALAAVRFPSAALDEREPARASDLLKVAIRYPEFGAEVLPVLLTSLRDRASRGADAEDASALVGTVGRLTGMSPEEWGHLQRRVGVAPDLAALVTAALPGLAALRPEALPWIGKLGRCPPSQQPGLSAVFRATFLATMARRPDVRSSLAGEPGADFDWFVVFGLSAHRLWHLLPPEDVRTILVGGSERAPLILRSLFRFRPDLRALAEARTAAANADLQAWMRHHLRAEYPFTLDPPSRVPRRPGRITVIGPARYVLGIADDCFSVCRALEASGADYEVLDFRPSPWIEVDNDKARFVGPRLVNSPSGERALFCCTLFEGASWALRNWVAFRGFGRAEIFAPWELARLPAGWEPATRLFDLILAPSRFVRDAFAAAGPTPAVHLPPSIELSPQHRAASAAVLRRRLRVPARTRLVATVFDFSSYLDRKNPTAAIAAFRRSLRRGPPAVLVIKTTRARRARGARAQLERALRGMPRAVWTDGAWSNAEVEALLRNACAFVSLHRSEGFGRNIAKALMLGTPAVVTDWSGSADMRDMAGYAGVQARPRRLRRGDYVCGEGQSWAEPDVRAAAAALSRAVARPRLGRLAGDMERFSRGRFAARLAAALETCSPAPESNSPPVSSGSKADARWRG